MSSLDLRPLSVGELLDRTFSLYRRHFPLFIGISAIPHLLVLALQLAELFVPESRFPFSPNMGAQFQRGASGFSMDAFAIWGAFFVAGLIVGVIAYLFSQGGTVFAVAELYLGRTTTIGQALGRVRGELVSLFFVVVFNLLVIFVSLLFLIIPAIYMACRLCVCVPAALLENLGPIDSLQRSFSLTRDNAGRAFLILLLYLAISYAAALLLTFPFVIAMQFAAHNPAEVRVWMALLQVGAFLSNVLVTPVMTIAAAIFYFDLRIRKEALDLQLMMNPLNGVAPAPSSASTTLLS